MRDKKKKKKIEKEREKKAKMGFEETELRLGLPGNNGGGSGTEVAEVVRKRGFSETESDVTDNVDLKLNLSSKEAGVDAKDKAKSLMNKEKNLLPADPAKPPAK